MSEPGIRWLRTAWLCCAFVGIAAWMDNLSVALLGFVALAVCCFGYIWRRF